MGAPGCFSSFSRYQYPTKIPARYARLYQRRSKEPMCSATGERPRSGKAMKRLLSTACKGFPIDVQRLIRRGGAKAKERTTECQTSSTAASTRNWQRSLVQADDCALHRTSGGS